MLPATTLLQTVGSSNLELVGVPAGLAQRGCRIVEFPRVHDPRGNLTYIESEEHVDFDIRRVYYLYDVPGGSERGGHAHKQLRQVLIAMSGSFDVVLDDGVDRQRFHLNRSYFGLCIPQMVWREIDNFSSGSVCMVLASEHYDEADYYRDWHEFKAAADLAGA
jgi:dTDP-4-dehydrorhamnose 3,5-epimerase-like enzyme